MYFLTILASLSESTIGPRALRTNLALRLIMPWRLPWAATLTLPEAVILKRLLAPLLVFSLGILLAPLRLRDRGPPPGLSKHESRHGMPRRATCEALLMRTRQMCKGARPSALARPRS